jgi:S1-C subfamily serine protease
VELLLPSLARISTDTGLGSGFVVGDGLVATNLHVIAGASDAKVSIDGRDFPVAGVVGYHAERDLAILRIEGAGKLPVVRLRKTDSLLQGEKIVTLGNPLGLDATVSDGVLSAIRRYEDTGDTVLQISAPISPGSSGGPVADENGNVVGVSTFLLKGGQNLNFAVPADYLTELLAQPTTASLADLEKYAALFK